VKKLKVLTILGTRPEIIRLSAVIASLEEYCNHVLVHTGQNYDYELNQVFFDELGMREPDYFLEVSTDTLGLMLGSTLIKTEEVLLKEKPDAVLVLGDTNSSIAMLMARRMKIPTYHMEAGNRCFDANVPEEINRKLVDHVADFNLVYSENARRNLIAEGLPSRFTYITGSPMREVLDRHRDRIDQSDVMSRLKLEQGKFFIVSVHREENVDSRENQKKVVACLKAVARHYKLPIIVSAHPRTESRLQSEKDSLQTFDIRFMKPFGFLDYIRLQTESFCVISDSGTISEESAMLGFPAVTMRNSIERPEALDRGSIVLTGLDPDTLLQAIDVVIDEARNSEMQDVPAEYLVTNTSSRVLKLIIGTAKLGPKWKGLADFSRYDWGR